MRSRVTLGRSSAAGGWSHSCVTAVTSSPSPRAKSISVADGTRETIRMAERLTDEQIEQGLSGSQWAREGDSIVRELELEDFAAAMAFVIVVGELAEGANHHPDILLHGWNKVRL